jgi:hypothetical protein
MKTKEDRMESFFLSETVKYLFLLFDEDNFLHQPQSTGVIFTTQGHLVFLPGELRGPPDEFTAPLLGDSERNISLRLTCPSLPWQSYFVSPQRRTAMAWDLVNPKTTMIDKVMAMVKGVFKS